MCLQVCLSWEPVSHWNNLMANFSGGPTETCVTPSRGDSAHFKCRRGSLGQASSVRDGGILGIILIKTDETAFQGSHFPPQLSPWPCAFRNREQLTIGPGRGAGGGWARPGCRERVESSAPAVQVEAVGRVWRPRSRPRSGFFEGRGSLPLCICFSLVGAPRCSLL